MVGGLIGLMNLINYDQFKVAYLQKIAELLDQHGYSIRPVVIGEGYRWKRQPWILAIKSVVALHRPSGNLFGLLQKC